MPRTGSEKKGPPEGWPSLGRKPAAGRPWRRRGHLQRSRRRTNPSVVAPAVRNEHGTDGEHLPFVYGCRTGQTGNAPAITAAASGIVVLSKPGCAAFSCLLRAQISLLVGTWPNDGLGLCTKAADWGSICMHALTPAAGNPMVTFIRQWFASLEEVERDPSSQGYVVFYGAAGSFIVSVNPDRQPPGRGRFLLWELLQLHQA